MIRHGWAVLLADGSLWVSPDYSTLPSFRVEQSACDPVTGKFHWQVKPSAGFQVMQAQHVNR